VHRRYRGNQFRWKNENAMQFAVTNDHIACCWH